MSRSIGKVRIVCNRHDSPTESISSSPDGYANKVGHAYPRQTTQANYSRPPSSRIGYMQALQRQQERKQKAHQRYLAKNRLYILPKDKDDAHADGYDTDLETDFADPRKSYSPEDLYMELCEKLKINPSYYFIRNLDSKVLMMPFQCMGWKGVKAMSVPLQLNNAITHLDLSGNFMEGKGLSYLMSVLFENHFISFLGLAYNNLRNKGARHLLEGLAGNTSLRKLDISSNCFCDKDAEHLRELIEINIALKEINLSNNEFLDEGGIILGEALPNNDTLEKLDLSWNYLRLKGAEGIAKGLKSNSRLEVLNLSMNGFDTNGAKILATALQSNKSLLNLDISNNRVGQVGCQALASMLEKNTTLETLHMGLNPVTQDGVRDLIKALQKNKLSALHHLHLTGVVTNQETMDVAGKIRADRELVIEVGYVLQPADLSNPNKLTYEQSPLEALLVFMSERNLRLGDLFPSPEKDKTSPLEKTDFVQGLKNVGAPLTENQIDQLTSTLLGKDDSKIDISKIVQKDTQEEGQ